MHCRLSPEGSPACGVDGCSELICSRLALDLGGSGVTNCGEAAPGTLVIPDRTSRGKRWLIQRRHQRPPRQGGAPRRHGPRCECGQLGHMRLKTWSSRTILVCHLQPFLWLSSRSRSEGLCSKFRHRTEGAGQTLVLQSFSRPAAALAPPWRPNCLGRCLVSARPRHFPSPLLSPGAVLAIFGPIVNLR